MDEYDAPVASARALTSLLKSLLLVTAATVLCSPPAAEQSGTKDNSPRIRSPLPPGRLRWESRQRSGVNTRRPPSKRTQYLRSRI